ncbi:DUF1194 domain-containing protein [Phyllobacterium zundukense]|uniref:VWFA domain-containing protein n=1 Tax=Phyllobacterium zundukense TaxID=1867719 RepID=A0A2N9VQQ7_9HYPH|nr:DUF1194 domain-containing protein [Phyllobacterium zundukense]ATU91470.1 hypothetical protein BLM14_07375 [Phyllobacterium zundukense]PIO41825.1 hypothetical protein B5P45_26535 [Phyllobacterium zundukense]
MRKTLLCMASASFLIAATSYQSSACVDIALVLAVDGSGSISDEEYAFQKYAIAGAFRDRDVLSALKSANTVAVSAVFWGDGEFAAQRLDWFIISGGKGAEPFARATENNQRIVFGNTDIGSGIWSALDLLSDPRLCATRSVVNVSGDGKETTAPKRRQVASLAQARLRAEHMGATVNALVIADDMGDLASYYTKRVIVGANAFVMDVRTYADYSTAIKKKLIRELSSQTVATLLSGKNRPPD